MTEVTTDVKVNGDGTKSQRYQHVPITVPELKQLCANCWIDANSLTIRSKLGEGAFAVVSRGTYEAPDGSKVAVAVKQLKAGAMQETDLKDMVMEAVVMNRLQHPCIVRLYGVGVAAGASDASAGFLLVSELCDQGTLKDLLYRQMEVPYKRLYSQQDALRWCHQIARGLLHLHTAQPMVIHRDMKPENVMLTSAGRKSRDAKIGDLGLAVLISTAMQTRRANTLARLITSRTAGGHVGHAREGSFALASRDPSVAGRPQVSRMTTTPRLISKSLARFTVEHSGGSGSVHNGNKARSYQLTGNTGSLNYMAPEVYKGQKYNEKVDTYAFGHIMFELLNYELTFYALKCRDQVMDLDTYVESVCVDGHRPDIPARFPQPIRDLIARCWAQEPEARPSMDTVVAELNAFLGQASDGTSHNLKTDKDMGQHDKDSSVPSCNCSLM